MALKLTALIKKNLTLLLRSKSSALIIFAGPLLLLLLMSAAFSTANAYAIIISTYTEEGSPLTSALLDGLSKKEMAILNAESKEQCIAHVRNGLASVCGIFPGNFNVEDGGTVTFYVDQTRQNFVYIVIEALTSEVLKKSKEIGEQLTTDLLDTLSTSSEALKDKQVLVESIGVNNRDVVDLAERTQNNLLHFNLSVSLDDIPFEALQSELNNLDTNNSAAEKYMNDIKQKVQNLVQNANYAGSTSQRAAEDLGTIAVLVNQNTEYATALDTGMTGIIQDIRSIKMQSAGKIVSPLDTAIEHVAPEKTHLNYLFPTLIALIIMFVGLFLASALEIREKIYTTHFKNVITPTSTSLFLLGNFLTTFIIMIFQLALLFGAAFFFFQEHLAGILGTLALTVILIIATFILFGMLIGTLFRSQETGLIASLSIGFLLLFFSNTLLPTEALPSYLHQLSTYNPFSIAHFLLNRILLFQQPFADALSWMIVLSYWILGLGLALATIKKLQSQVN